MTNDKHADPPASDGQRSQTRLAVAAMLVPLFFAIGFATCIIGTYHQPHPNNITVGVVGPAAQTQPLRAGIEQAGGSAFQVSSVATVAEATRNVRERVLVAAFVPSANPQQPATGIVATASGRLVATATEGFLRAVAAKQGTQLVVQDVRPLPSGDEIGLGVFLFLIILTIAGYLAATVLQTAAPELPPKHRYPLLLANAVLVPTIVYLIAGLGFGTYTGSAATILAFIGVGALYAFVVGLVTRLFQVWLGPPALFVSLAIFVFLNIPSLGATYTPNLLPAFWRFLNHFWLGAETVNAERGILYFDGDGVGANMLRLLAWAAVIVALLLLPIARKLMHQRQLPVGATSEPERGLLTSP